MLIKNFLIIRNLIYNSRFNNKERELKIAIYLAVFVLFLIAFYSK